MPTLRSLAFAATFMAVPLGMAYAQDADPAVARTRAAADAAHEQLVDRYRAVWSRLSPAQKAEFGSRERAWLNGGRAEQERLCVESQPAASIALATQACRLAVTERRLATLPATVIQASARP
jgi:uncharacterized protein YecT (DUF1311 family)